MDQKQREKSIYKVTILGSIINSLLVVFKFTAGILGHSSAMIADAVHSLSDFITDIIVLVFVHLSNKPKDKNHDYGHGKYETLATTIVGAILFIIALGVCYNAIADVLIFIEGGYIEVPGMLAFWAAIISIALKELAFRITIRVAHKVDSQVLIANAWHHRSDSLSSIGTAIGIGGAILLGSHWRVLDPIAAIVVSFFILKVAYKLIKPAIEELLESSLPDEVETEITDITMQDSSVKEMHNLRTRRIGNHYAIEMHIRMKGDTTIHEAHDKTREIETRLKKQYGPDTHVCIHVEPLKIDGQYIQPNTSNNETT